MVLAIISDLHANLEATQVVLEELDRIGPDRVICLGDLIGYGPNPDEVVSLIRERGYETVKGNHDSVVNGAMSFKFFREPNQSLLKKSVEMLSAENREWLGGLPMTIETDEWIAAHAHPLETGSWPYLDNAIKCQQLLKEVKQRLVFVGHTHIGGIVANEFGVFGIKDDYKYVINPGSVGQSRDKDYRASFLVIDFTAKTHEFIRLKYPLAETLKAYDRLGIKSSHARFLMQLR
ncbi:MAG: metallophosphatase family protein [Candidatus Cyclonatronum sp.]|uniref:metallophosphoesterase family protein n=1 Tax=Cyclonatronum sp. TaxID=3024185 RepID=UPI0025C291FD|nr:metallophosphoesterase family protein [Cyclonatronum sp.]MCC5934612.1 metallophosphoesterase family protein [Balneolales bacterium]MCH8485511.1 metallophosphatase family protein [Cyclonatronum sp.]